MGNCQAAEAATVLIQHPGGKIERFYWSISANEVMNLNPGHYVALVVTVQAARPENGAPVKKLKLLKPEDNLVIGQVYKLISIEDVLKEFAAKKCDKLGKLLKERGVLRLEMKKKVVSLPPAGKPKPVIGKGTSVVEEQGDVLGAGRSRVVGKQQHHHHHHHHGGSSTGGMRQWKPALQSIAEVGT
ncbi:hypothetical protein LguiA_017671 [Lonicera macranthoides]